MPQERDASRDYKVFIGLDAGLNTDAFQEAVKVSDLNNMEASPAGNSVVTRRGSVIVDKDAPALTGDNAGRVAFTVHTNVANLTDGTWKINAINTSGGNALVASELFKPRTNLPGDTAQSIVFFDRDTYVVDLGETVAITINRINAIDRTVTVLLNSSNGSGSAGTDYTAITNRLVTFDAGVTSQTVTFTSTAASQTANKTALLTLSAPTGGATIGTPNPATVLMLATYVPVGFSFNESPKLLRVLMYRKMQNDVTCHYLNGYTGVYQDFGRCGPDQMFILSYDLASDNVYVALYSISQMRADGGAYSAGAGTIGAAITTGPYAEFVLYNTDLTSTIGDLHYICYDERRFYMHNGQSIFAIDMNAGTSQAYPMPQIDADSSKLPYEAPVNFFRMGYADSDGRLVLFLEDTTGDYFALAAINPETMLLESTTGFLEGKELNQSVPLYGGGYFAVDEDTSPERIYRLGREMSALEPLGTFDSYNESALPINKSNVLFMSEAPSFSFVRQVLIGESSITVQQSYTAGAWTPGIIWFNESRAIMQFISGSTRTVLLLNTSTGATVTTCDNEDRYGGESVDPDITTAPDDGWDPDGCWYHARNISGRIR